MLIYCVECKQDVDAKLVTGKEVYPHRSDLYNLLFYKCPACGGFVGTHKDGTNKPLGCIPTIALKRARIGVHDRMDKLWKSGRIKRKDLYNKISEYMGYQYHNGETRSVEECNKALCVINRIEREL